MSWLRIRFKSDAPDFRPIYKPPALPEGPWWCSGYDSNGNAILVAFVKSKETLMKQWPEAWGLDIEEREEITFTGRFPRPDWWGEISGV